ncbi:helix-turn-helix domain-containing protein [Haloprofundus salinisoli]|uniref:helix-turn-helix domain-containing protein n=1 Tax=Haloprofundus salinisoli TaxID=2876193 RepID=UPI001CCD95F7|nr:helix-turn-helix domain-containing protein [Haloprofundus salinisoli]
MKHVRLTLDAGGREAEVHPMYDLLVNAPFVERATAMHWNYTEDELGIMHYVEGDATAFRASIETIPEVVAFELTRVGSDEFYVYIRDATTEPLRQLFGVISNAPVVVIPPVEYEEDGTVSYSVYGPADEIQTAIDAVPEPITVEVTQIGGLNAVPGLLEALLSDRQREAVDTALDLGYYEIPRRANQEDVAAVLGCAPSTAAEHLQKAETKVMQAFDG